MMKRNIYFLMLLVSLFGCKGKTETDALRGIYHWKTTFGLNDAEQEFMGNHNVKRLYIRMFDVGYDWNKYDREVVPIATTVFKGGVPEGVEVVPTVYIVEEAIGKIHQDMGELARKIVKRVLAMCSWNGLGEIKEIQYDCDWTKSSRQKFEDLCRQTKSILAEKGILLSGTIRLHQLEEAEYPFDAGVLMMYNTGAVKSKFTKNSILDYDDAYKYLSVDRRISKFIKAREHNCKIIDVAYPTFSWGVVFYNEKHMRKLVKDHENYKLAEGESMRVEKSEMETILKVKRLVDRKIGKVCRGNIIYHLDSNNLGNYSRDEIERIYN